MLARKKEGAWKVKRGALARSVGRGCHGSESELAFRVYASAFGSNSAYTGNSRLLDDINQSVDSVLIHVHVLNLHEATEVHVPEVRTRL